MQPYLISLLYSRVVEESLRMAPRCQICRNFIRNAFRETYFIVFYYVHLLVNMLTSYGFACISIYHPYLRFYLKPAHISGLFSTFISRLGTLPASSSSQTTGEIMVLILQSLCPYPPFHYAGNSSVKRMLNLTKTQRK